MKKSYQLKHLTLLALFAGFIFPHGLSASSNEDEKKTIGQKLGKESARVVGQVEREANKVEKSWKEQRKKDKEKKKQKQ
ncbi:MAG: hypothetical protein JNJ47_06680 [Alphaproteobacteria bacterium]|nr:hypothetical protein [Alphaproteobacteria bacterium]